MSFSKFVEIGRVIRVTYGAETNKLAVIVDILDMNRILIDGPSIERQIINTKRVALTDIVIAVPRGARTSVAVKAFEAEGVAAKFGATTTGKKLAAKAAKAELNDFGRFKLMVAKKHRSALVAKKLA